MVKIVISSFIALLVVFTDVFNGFLAFFNSYSGILIAIITAIYAYTTHKILQASQDQTRELQRQNTLIKKQHEQNLGIQNYEKRRQAIMLLASSSYSEINIYDVKYLFSPDIAIRVSELSIRQASFQQELDKLIKFTEALKEISPKVVRTCSIVRQLLSMLPMDIVVAESVLIMLEESLTSNSPDFKDAGILKNRYKKVIEEKQFMDKRAAELKSQMEDIITKSI